MHCTLPVVWIGQTGQTWQRGSARLGSRLGQEGQARHGMDQTAETAHDRQTHTHRYKRIYGYESLTLSYMTVDRHDDPFDHCERLMIHCISYIVGYTFYTA